jgi:hypothetical protein
MKDCRLIQDLYPMYMEDELSPPVKQMVEGHLKSCSNCALIYESGEGFEEEETLEIEEEVPKTLDDRVKLKLKFRRMKFIATILAVIIAMMLFNKYEDSREEVFTWSDMKYREARNLIQLVESTRHENLDSLKFNEDMYTRQKVTDFDSFNWWEELRLAETRFNLNVKKDNLFTTLETLHHKQQTGEWDEVDTKTYSKLKEYSYQYMNEVEDEYMKFHHGYSSYLELVDFKGLEIPISDINELTYHYNRFHKLPEDVERLTENELKQRIGKLLKVKPSHIELTSNSFFNNDMGIKGFDVKNRYHGDIDLYTGTLMDLNTHHLEEMKKDESINKEKAKEKAEQFLKKMLGNETEFTIEYKEIHQEHIYGFGFKPVNNGYPLLDKNENLVDFIIGVNIEGKIDNLMINRTYLGENFFEKEYEEVISPEKGHKILQQFVEEEDKIYTTKRKYKFVSTFIILSRKTGDYELVHAFDLANGNELKGENRNGERRFINVETGKEELIYVFSP